MVGMLHLLDCHLGFTVDAKASTVEGKGWAGCRACSEPFLNPLPRSAKPLIVVLFWRQARKLYTYIFQHLLRVISLFPNGKIEAPIFFTFGHCIIGLWFGAEGIPFSGQA